MSRNVDLIAIAVLLLAFALFSGAKRIVVMTLNGPVHFIHLDDGQEVRVPSPPLVPRVPRIPIQRD